MKLELKHLAPYLPYHLNCVYPEKPNENFVLVGLKNPYKTVNKWFLTAELRLDKSTRIHSHVFNTEKQDVNFKPILRPLFDLKINKWRDLMISYYKSINIEPQFTTYESGNNKKSDFTLSVTYKIMGDAFTDLLINRGSTKEVPLHFYEFLLNNHFDVFGLIENGLAIDINSIENVSV